MLIKINQTDKAVEILKKGGIIAYPTDTVYGIGCNIFDEKAVKKIFKLKGRDFNNPLPVAVSSLKMLEDLAFLTDQDKEIIQKLLPGPIMVILPKKPKVSDLITNGSKFVGIRIPEHEQAIEIIKQAGFPIITTSANLSGEEPVTEAEKVDLKVDFVVKGECKHKIPSTVIDLKNNRILRQGAGVVREQGSEN